MPTLIPTGRQQYFGNDGKPLVGGKLYTYRAGTSEPRATFADANGTVPNPNPVILDARGEASIFWAGSYKVVLADAQDNVIWTADKVVETNLGYRTSADGSAIIPTGTAAQRDPEPFPGYFRYNVDNAAYEGYYDNKWVSFIKSFNGVDIPADGHVTLALKSVGGVSLVGAGNVEFKTVNGNSLVGAGDVLVQAPLVSGTNIKTVGGQSIVGPGNVSVVAALHREDRAADAVLTAADAGKWINITANSFTQTFDLSANLGAGWSVYYSYSGAGNITLDPNGAETIDGKPSITIIPGEIRRLQCDGAKLSSMLISGSGNHEVVVHTGNGYGTTNTKIRRFTTVLTSIGSAITYADSATLGASFTINEAGLYSLYYSDGSANNYVGISLNAAPGDLSLGIDAIPVANRLSMVRCADQNAYNTSRIVRLAAGDIVRPHGINSTGTTNAVYFAIRKVGE